MPQSRRHSATAARIAATAIVLAVATAADAHKYQNAPTPVPVSHLGSDTRVGCLANVEVTGVILKPSARVVRCDDGDPFCDRDGERNGQCEFWVRTCLNGDGFPRCGASVVRSVEYPGADRDDDLKMMERVLEVMRFPERAETCTPMTALRVPVGGRPERRRPGRKSLTVKATGLNGSRVRRHVRFVCRPYRPPKGGRTMTFATLQKTVFEKSCAFSGCHGATNTAANLVLTGPGAWDSLVNGATFQPNERPRVVRGSPRGSLLAVKLRGTQNPVSEGARMPLNRSPLPDSQIEAIEAWIKAGAPRDTPFRASIGESNLQPRFPPPPPPEGGYQLASTQVFLGDVKDRPGCEYRRLGNPTDIFVAKWEMYMYEGSHHFDLIAFDCQDRDGDGVNDCDEPDFDSRFPPGFRPCEDFMAVYPSAVLVGALTPGTILDNDTARTGLAHRLHRNQPVLLNPHFVNTYADTMVGAWINVIPAPPEQVRHQLKFRLDAFAYGLIHLPPNTRSSVGWYACAFKQCPGGPPPAAENFVVTSVASHSHARSHKIVGDIVGLDGQREAHPDDLHDPTDDTYHTYVNFDWYNPIGIPLEPRGRLLQAGQEFRYSCLYDNGIERPVKLGCEETYGVPPGRTLLSSILEGKSESAGAVRQCTSDRDCVGFGTGRCVAANLVYGPERDDAMCALNLTYYECPSDAASCWDER